jgi:hypothetical protein
MSLRILLTTTLIALLVGCATRAETLPATTWRTTLVTATGTATPGRIQGVSRDFTFNGRVHGHATLVADGTVSPVKRTFTFKWFNGSTQVHERSTERELSASPFYLVHAVPGSVLGVGNCRVELHAEGRVLAMREFSMSEQ